MSVSRRQILQGSLLCAVGMIHGSSPALPQEPFRAQDEHKAKQQRPVVPERDAGDLDHFGAELPLEAAQEFAELLGRDVPALCDPRDFFEQGEVEWTHKSLNDGSCEGMRHRKLPIMSVQYHPEAAPGPHDSLYLFREFRKVIEGVYR